MRVRRQRIRNASAEAAQFRLRALVGFGLVLLGLLGLAAWYFRLQVVDHDEYARASEANRIKPHPVVPARGLIYDRKGRLLADNVPAYRIDVTPEDAGDIPRMLAQLSQVVALTPEEIARFEAARKATRSFRSITLKARVTDEEVARFAVDRWRFPGVEVVPYLNRRYLHGDLFAHVIGYVGRTDEGDVERYGRDQILFPHTGRTGLERAYDEQLRGRVGYEQVETNVEGRALRRIGMVPATERDHFATTGKDPRQQEMSDLAGGTEDKDGHGGFVSEKAAVVAGRWPARRRRTITRVRATGAAGR